YHEIKTRRAALAAGAPLPDDEETLRKLREQARAQRHRPRQAAPVTSAPPDGASESPAPAADAPKLAPDKQARIDRAWNDYVAGVEKPKRERRPRITQS